MSSGTSSPPSMAPYSRHILICTGPYCDPGGQGKLLYAHLRYLLGELGQYDNPQRVKRGMSPCLGVCSGGPIVVVYPEGVWYHHVDLPILERIVEEHLARGEVVEEHVFHRAMGNSCECPR